MNVVKERPQPAVETYAKNHTKPTPLIQLQDVSKVYETGSGDFVALKDISFDVYPGEFLAIVGKSGAGKTTLLNMISGVSEISSGDVVFQKGGESPVSIDSLSEDDLAVWRGKNLGIVYQSFELLPTLDLLTNVMLPQDFMGVYKSPISQERAMELLEIVGLTEHARKLPAHISGGQKQRVAIARALINDPTLIVADEPTGSLDTVTAETIFDIFANLVEQGKTVIMVTHDHSLAGRASRHLTISDGEMVANVDSRIVVDAADPEIHGVHDRVEEREDAGSRLPSYRGRGDHVERPRSEVAISLRKVVKQYENAAGKFLALRGIDLELNYGQFVAIVGKSGSGKSTLLNMLTGIDHPSSGEVVMGGEHIYEMSESKRALWRGNNVGIVFQFFQLLPTLSLLENTMLPMDYCNVYPPNERPERAMELLRMVGLEEHAHDLPGAVSNGQQQSAAIARALATDPPIIVADEPTGNLDSRSADTIIRVFQELARRGKTILIVTHDPSLTSRTDQTVIISDGEIIDKTIARALPLLDHPQMLKATKAAAKRSAEAGETIIRQGEQVDHFYMVESGMVDIVITSASGQEMNVARLGEGQFFGEAELLSLGRSDSIASVRAWQAGPVELAVILEADFLTLLNESPSQEAHLSGIATQRRAENDTQRTMEPQL